MVRRRWILLAVALASCTTPVVAQTNASIHFDPTLLDGDFSRISVDPELARLVASLDDPSFAAREEAEAAILVRRAPLSSMLAVLSREDLTAEQRQRLVGVVSEQVERIPRGALGIRMDTAREVGQGVVVSGFVEGMPAAHVLEPGDRIVAIDDAPTPTTTQLIGAVQRRLPGEVVRLRVHRAGAPDPMELDVVLGSVEQLEQDANDPLARQNPVLAERTAFIAELERRFGPPTITLLAGTSAKVDAPPVDPVEGHPEVTRLRRYLAMVESGALLDASALRPLWQRRIQRLRQELLDSRRPAGDREALRAVIARCEDLLRDDE